MKNTTIQSHVACATMVLALVACSDGGRTRTDTDTGTTAPDASAPADAAVDSAPPPDTSIAPDVGPSPLPTDSWLGGYTGTGADTIDGVGSDPLGNVYVVGRFDSELTIGGETLSSRGEQDVVVAKYDAEGAPLWAQSFGGEMTEVVGGIAVDSEGNSYVVGRFRDPLLVGGRVRLEPIDQEDVFLASFDTDGELRWARAYGGMYSEGGRDVAVGGGVVCFAGDFQGGFDLGFTTLEGVWQFDAFVACVDSDDAAIRWAHAFTGWDNDVATAVAVDADGNALVGLSFGADLDVFDETLTNRGGFDAALVKISAIGEHLFTRHVGADGAEELTGLDVDASGNAFFTGVFSTGLTLGDADLRSADSHDVYVASVTPEGEHRWATSFGAMGFDQPLDLEVGGGRVHITGRFDGTVDVGGHEISSSGDYDAFLATFDMAGAAVGAWTVGGGGADQANGVTPDPHGGAYVGGHHTDPITMGETTLTADGLIGAFLAHLAPEDIDLI